jgi:tetratricopeptide (TPR) repeat protein
MYIAGICASCLGDYAASMAYLSRVVDAEPNSFEALTALCTVCREARDFDRAVAAGARAAALKPSDPQAQNNLGRAYLAARRLDEAATTFEKAIAVHPTFAAAFHNLGRVRQLEGRDGDAARCYGRAAELEPNAGNLLAYGQVLLALYDLDGAEAAAREAVARFEPDAAPHLLLCGVLIERQQIEEADECLRRAIERDPKRREAFQIAARQLPLGHIEAAIENLQIAITQNLRQVAVYESLTRNKKITEADRDLVDGMESLLDGGGFSSTEEASLHYALGKAYEDLGEYEISMRRYDDANRLVRAAKLGDASFDRERAAWQTELLMRSFPAGSRIGRASPSEKPVLIIGAMRSGTTLAEQIVSSHRDVAAAGERLFWSRNWTRVLEEETVDQVALAGLGEEYIAELAVLGQGAKRVTDKLPGNYMFAGLIHAALPNARFIHMRRNSADTALSIWATPNHAPSEGGHEKAGIVFMYRQYLRLMEHWRKVLPADRLLEVDYEELVADRERVTRQMVDFCGLEWDDACLEPERNPRAVSTLSVWQVRQPVYRTSVERWRKFEPWLGEFKKLLEVHHRDWNEQSPPLA